MLYIVHISINDSRRDEWLDWMRQTHIPEVLETGCFQDATVARDPESGPERHTTFRIYYRARSEEEIVRYQKEYATDLQADHSTRFQGEFEASREILPVLDHQEAAPA